MQLSGDDRYIKKKTERKGGGADSYWELPKSSFGIFLTSEFTEFISWKQINCLVTPYQNLSLTNIVDWFGWTDFRCAIYKLTKISKLNFNGIIEAIFIPFAEI